MNLEGERVRLFMCLMYSNYALTFWWSFIFTHSIRLSADTVKQESTLLMEI